MGDSVYEGRGGLKATGLRFGFKARPQRGCRVLSGGGMYEKVTFEVVLACTSLNIEENDRAV